MQTGNIIKNLREKNHLTQQELAERINITRQAISRWENGITSPDIDMLKILSREFDVSINTLLGSPRNLICQCCGMPLSEDEYISHEKDGSFNEDYCKWCYADGEFAYKTMDSLIDFLIDQMPNHDKTDEKTRRIQFESYLSALKYWK